SGAFPSAPVPGPATVEVELLKAGGTQTQLRANLVQDGQVCLSALVTQGILTEDDPTWTSVEPLDLPPEQDLPRAPNVFQSPVGPFRVNLMEVVETRLVGNGTPTMTGAVASYQRLADGSDWDPLSLLLALD